MKTILENLPEEVKEKLQKKEMPEQVEAMKATLTEDYFSSVDWLYEKKWDGYRILAYKNGNNIKLLTRNFKDYTHAYPNIAQALKQQKEDNFIIDGEVVAFEKEKSNFSILQRQKKLSSSEIKYFVFDIIYLDNYDLTKIDLINRKKILENTINFSQDIINTEYIIQNGLEYYKKACSLGWEGVIAKKINSIYEHRRSKKWLKFKCVNQQEFVIVGYTNPSGSRTGFGSLLLGYYKDNKLHYAGKVGTGFNEAILESLYQKLKQITIPRQESTLSEKIKDKDVHFVKPELVCEIKFTEWTNQDRLRHPSFMGLRYDKSPKDVIKENPK